MVFQFIFVYSESHSRSLVCQEKVSLKISINYLLKASGKSKPAFFNYNLTEIEDIKYHNAVHAGLSLVSGASLAPKSSLFFEATVSVTSLKISDLMI